MLHSPYRSADVLVFEWKGGYHNGFPLDLAVHLGAVPYQIPFPCHLTGQLVWQGGQCQLSLPQRHTGEITIFGVLWSYKNIQLIVTVVIVATDYYYRTGGAPM